MKKENKKLYHLHVLVFEDDLKTIETLCSNHGDRSLIIRGVIGRFAQDLREKLIIDAPVEERGKENDN